jgi:hypothetical protein
MLAGRGVSKWEVTGVLIARLEESMMLSQVQGGYLQPLPRSPTAVCFPPVTED